MVVKAEPLLTRPVRFSQGSRRTALDPVKVSHANQVAGGAVGMTDPSGDEQWVEVRQANLAGHGIS
jgi:hypothetical protein